MKRAPTLKSQKGRIVSKLIAMSKKNGINAKSGEQTYL